MRGIVILSGSSHPELAKSIANRIGVPLCNVILKNFSNQEIGVEIRQSVRDMDVYIVQTSYQNVNDYLMELLILIHACKIASAARGINKCLVRVAGLYHSVVTAILPCFPYSRHVSNPLQKPRLDGVSEWQNEVISQFNSSGRSTMGYRFWTSRSGSLVASMIEAAGADHVMTVELHNPQTQGFFNVPVDNLPSSPLLIKHLKHQLPNYSNVVVISPDAGGAKRAIEVANLLGTGFALIHQNKANIQDIDNLVLVGSVEGKDVIIIDDMADTSTTIVQAALLCRRNGAQIIIAAITHGIFSGDSVKYMEGSEINKIIVSNTVPQVDHLKCCTKLQVFDISPILSEAIRRAHNGESISYLFSPNAFQ